MWEWRFRAKLIRVVDGDTFWLRIDNGFRMFSEHPFRLWGKDEPELNTPEGKAARDRVTQWFVEHEHGLDWPLHIYTDKTRQTFNRYIARILCAEELALIQVVLSTGAE